MTGFLHPAETIEYLVLPNGVSDGDCVRLYGSVVWEKLSDDGDHNREQPQSLPVGRRPPGVITDRG